MADILRDVRSTSITVRGTRAPIWVPLITSSVPLSSGVNPLSHKVKATLKQQ